MGKSKSKPLKYFYGIPHAHTIFSTGKGTPYDAYEYAKNKGLNFLAVTDLNSYLSNDITISHNTVTRWVASNHIVEKMKRKYDNFTPLLGFETKTSSYGDLNIINCNTFFTGILTDLRLLVLWMINNPNSFVTINHPHKNILNLEYNELINKLITSIEVGNGCFPYKYERYDRHYYALLDKGWKLGAINSQDNHKINFGDSDNLTCIIAPELTTNSITEAFRSRSTFSTESRTLKMNFSLNDYPMGSEVKLLNKRIIFNILAEDRNNKIDSIEIVSNNNTTIKKINNINLNSIKYIYQHEHNPKETWYIVRINQEGKRLAISSPIFVEI